MTFSTFSPPVYRGRVISPILSIWQKQEVAARPAVLLDFIARKRVYHIYHQDYLFDRILNTVY